MLRRVLARFAAAGPLCSYLPLICALHLLVYELLEISQYVVVSDKRY